MKHDTANYFRIKTDFHKCFEQWKWLEEGHQIARGITSKEIHLTIVVSLLLYELQVKPRHFLNGLNIFTL